MSEMSNPVPKRRFKDFQNADAWEQRKLGDLVKSHNAGVYISKEHYGDGINIIGVGNIYNSDRFDGEIYRLAPVKDNKFLLEENDLIYGESSLVPEGIARTICVTKNGAGSAFAWHTRRVKLDNKIVNSLFATLELNYHTEVRKYLMNVSTQTALTGMTTEGYFGAKLFLPTIEEQDKICRVFVDLDNLITLHQRKLEKMKSMKAAYLAEMFPKKGESVPKRRFAGFTDPWEQRKLEDGTSKIGDGLHGTPRYSESGKVFFVNGNNFVDGNIVCTEDTKCVSEQEQSPDDKALNENTILMSINGTIGNLAFYRGEKVMLGKSAAYITVRDFDKEFLYSYFQTSVIENHFMNSLTGTTIKNLGLKTIRETQIYTPSTEEQEQIGTFFSNLDNLITLHQRKLEKLHNIKKAYLNEMFI